METHPFGLIAIDPNGWYAFTTRIGSSAFILLTLLSLVLLLLVLYWFSVIDRVVSAASLLMRFCIRKGFHAWERWLAWASWPVFLAIQLSLLTFGNYVADTMPAITVLAALTTLTMGLIACLAYMFIDLERYEVARGYKALHNPLKGQRLAIELALHGHKVEVPLLATAAVGMIGAFALLNFGLFEILGTRWYSTPIAEVTYLEFLASAVVHLLSVVDLLNVANTNNFANVAVVKPVSSIASFFLTMFRSFFTLVLLQQIFASVRKGRLLVETISDFWSPHEPIHERARAALPQYGAVALSPLLVSLPSAESLTREQRSQLPQILSTIGPTAIPELIYHLEDSNEHVRAVAVATLGHLRATIALEKMSQMAKDPSDIVRLSIVEALGQMTTPQSDRAAQRQKRTSNRGFRRLLRWKTLAVPALSPIAIALPLLRTALEDSSASVRAQSAYSLGRMGVSASLAIPDLTRLLADPDETVRGKAAESLGLVGASDPETVSLLTGLLGDSSPAIRAIAARALGNLRTSAASAVPTLVSLFQDSDESVRTAAADAVGKIGVLSQAAAETLTEGLESQDNVVRARTAEALGDIGGAAAGVASALVDAAGDDNDRVRAKAVEALGKIGESVADVAVPHLVRALRDPDNWVSALAAEALGEMGNGADEAIPAIVRSLEHANPQVRANAAEALGKLGSSAIAAVPALEKTAHDDNAEVRMEAVRALSTIGPPSPSTLKIVHEALSDTDSRTRATAAEAFGTWGKIDKASFDVLLALLKDTNDAVKARVARILPRLSEATPEVIEGLVRRLADDDSDWVRVEAARSLGQYGKDAIAAGAELLRAAQTGDVGLREEAMRALAVSQPPEAVAAFTSGLRDADSGVRKIASAGWRKAAEVPEAAVAALIEALHDPEVQVRANAAHALGRLDPTPTEAIPLLAECITHADAGLRLNAALALLGASGRTATAALRPLFEDPNLRLRLIAARRVLLENASDPVAISVVVDVLTSATASMRKIAADMLEPILPTSTSILQALQERLLTETDPEVRNSIAESIVLLSRVVQEKTISIPQTTSESITTSHDAA